jgi:hypothetical protein
MLSACRIERLAAHELGEILRVVGPPPGALDTEKPGVVAPPAQGTFRDADPFDNGRFGDPLLPLDRAATDLHALRA